ncbi:MAG: HAD-IC family P-type ATPase, partial [Lachnospiraceae bacterium]|nr:HAD-IC family P-type ATPase [Lachnospiraceae bacterium]
MTLKLKRRLIRVIAATGLFLALFGVSKAGWLSRFPKEWILVGAFAAVYLYIGYDVLVRAAKNIVHGKVFDENLLMVIATAAAFAIGEYEEALAVMVFYQIGEWFQDYAVGKSRNSIKDLMAIAPEYANVLKGDDYEETDPEDVEIGDVFLVKPGERVPLDGRVLEGESLLDTSSITGESVPKRISAGEEIVSGSVNLKAAIIVEASKRYEDSTVSRILELVENASSRKAKAEHFIIRFAKFYTPSVTIAAVLLAFIPPLFFQAPFIEWIRRACTFLVISCPCAVVISVPLGFFGGIGAASKFGVLVKGSNYLEMLARVDTVAFDKTGTLT